MTDAQAAWLRKLRDEGPQNPKMTTIPGMKYWCLTHGLTTLFGKRMRPKHAITPAGLAALAEHERALKAKGDA
jgi:hypothetical protein